MKVAIGRFGPYIQHDNKFYSLPKTVDPMSVTEEESIEIIKNKRQSDANKIIKTFDKTPDLQILNGRYGAYIAYKGSNYKIPKTVTPAEMTLEDAMKIVNTEPKTEKKKGGFRKKK